MTLPAVRLASPPCLTGGETSHWEPVPVTRCVVVDWVSVVFPRSAVAGDLDAFVASILRLFDGTVTQLRQRPAGIHGYAYSLGSDVGGVLLAWGGERTNDTVWLQIPGDACARVACFGRLREFIEQRAGWLTRLDLAYDCIDGAHDLELAVEMYKAGAFNARRGGAKSGKTAVKCSQAGNWITPDGSGRTLYIGKRENGKQLCIYEKGLQLAKGQPCDPALARWVRWELRLSNVDRVLPLDALTNPAPYLVGAFPAFEMFMGAEGTRIPTRTAQERITVAGLKHHCREAYGPLVGLMRASGVDAVQICDELARAGQPRRLSAPTAAELEDRANLLARLAADEELAAWEHTP